MSTPTASDKRMANRAARNSHSSCWAGDRVNWTVAFSGMNGSVPDHRHTKAESENVIGITVRANLETRRATQARDLRREARRLGRRSSRTSEPLDDGLICSYD